jgi:exonuclease SbcD
MRILHTADWHLGRRIGTVSRLDEQRKLLDRLVREVRRRDPDVIVHAGDVFDVFTPSAEAERLYYGTMQRLAEGGQRCVLVVAGNHDSSSRLTAPRTLLEATGVIVHGDPHDPDDVPEPRTYEGFELLDAGPGWVEIATSGDEATFHLLPFPTRSRLPTNVDQQDVPATEVVETLQGEVPDPDHLVSHLYVSTNHDVEQDRDDFVGGAYAVDPGVLEPYEAAFLGHLHQAFPSKHWRYAGAPMAFDFDDPGVARGAWLYEHGDWEQIELGGGRPLRAVHTASVDEALALAEDDEDAWTRLIFERGTVVARNQREKVCEAFGDRLVDIRFEEPDDEPDERFERVEVGEIDPEQAFRGYVEDQEGTEPDDELVELFLEVLVDEDEPGDKPVDEPGQATLEVDP